MSAGFLNGAMLLGLIGISVPIVIHLLNRRQEPIVDWAAMQFLELGLRSTAKPKLPTEWLLLLARIGLLALLALALARPFFRGGTSFGSIGQIAALESSRPRRDIVLILDGSESMSRKIGGSSIYATASAWARRFFKTTFRSGDSASILVARDRTAALFDSPTFDADRLDSALASVSEPRGSSDLAAAVAQALFILESSANSQKHIIILSDDQAFAFRGGDLDRWRLVKEMAKRSEAAPSIWGIDFAPSPGSKKPTPSGRLGRIELSRGLIVPGVGFQLTVPVSNTGNAALEGEIELLSDGAPLPGTSHRIGPLAKGAETQTAMNLKLESTGPHLLSARLVVEGEETPSDNASHIPIDVSGPIKVLIVNGDPSREPFRGETDFLEAALAPEGSDAPRFRSRIISPKEFVESSLEGAAVVVLADVDRISSDAYSWLTGFVESGGGVLYIPGDRIDEEWLNALAAPSLEQSQAAALEDAFSWFPVRLGKLEGRFIGWQDREDLGAASFHPDPSSFSGQALTGLSGVDVESKDSMTSVDRAPLASASIQAYRILDPLGGSSVLARLDNGSPWIVEKRSGKGAAIVVASPFDAKGGSLPVNPDFIPLVHELLLELAGADHSPRIASPGEPLIFKLEGVPESTIGKLRIIDPDGRRVAPAVVSAGSSTPSSKDQASPVVVRYEDTFTPGIYKLVIDEKSSKFAYGVVVGDPRERNMETLSKDAKASLSSGWRCELDVPPERLASKLLELGTEGNPGLARREFWRVLVFAALGMLCLELFLARKLVKARGLEPQGPTESARGASA